MTTAAKTENATENSNATTKAPVLDKATVKTEPDAIKKGPDLPDHSLGGDAKTEAPKEEDAVTKALREQAEARANDEKRAADMEDENKAQEARLKEIVKNVYDLPKDALKDATVEAVYGPIVDAETAHVYNTVPGPVLKDNGWLRMQIKYGKIRIVG